MCRFGKSTWNRLGLAILVSRFFWETSFIFLVGVIWSGTVWSVIRLKTELENGLWEILKLIKIQTEQLSMLLEVTKYKYLCK